MFPAASGFYLSAVCVSAAAETPRGDFSAFQALFLIILIHRIILTLDSQNCRKYYRVKKSHKN